jgi:hypothetical protein
VAGDVSANLASRGLLRGQLRIPTAVNLGFVESLLPDLHATEWIPGQTHRFSQNLIVLGIEHRNSGSVAMKSEQQITGTFFFFSKIYLHQFISGQNKIWQINNISWKM